MSEYNLIKRLITLAYSELLTALVFGVAVAIVTLNGKPSPMMPYSVGTIMGIYSIVSVLGLPTLCLIPIDMMRKFRW